MSNMMYKNGIKKLEERKYEIDSIGIKALPPVHNSDMCCFIFGSSIRLTYGKSYAYLAFDNNIVAFKQSLMKQLSADLTKITTAQYGYCFQRRFLEGPLWYSTGTISGLKYGDPPEFDSMSI